MKPRRKGPADRRGLLSLLKGDAKTTVVSRSTPETSAELSDADLAFYRADFRQRLHRELRRIFERLREEEGLTYAELAKRLKINRSVITRRFKGQANLTLDILSDMFRAMGARPEFKAYLYEDIRKQKESRTYTTSHADALSVAEEHWLKAPEIGWAPWSTIGLVLMGDYRQAAARAQIGEISATKLHRTGSAILADWHLYEPASDVEVLDKTRAEDTRTQRTNLKHSTVN